MRKELAGEREKERKQRKKLSAKNLIQRMQGFWERPRGGGGVIRAKWERWK